MAKSNSEYKSIQKKLVAAVAMVLVASVMVVSSSYAWFTLSTAPEVTGITTSVGSNGNLEMALRTVQDLNSITTATGESFPVANNYWGNLVNLSDPSYHLDSIALAPARLNIVLDTQNSKYADNDYVELSNTELTYAIGDTYKSGVIKNVVHESAGGYTKQGDDTTYAHKYTITVTELYQPAYKLNGAAGSAPYLQTPIYGTDGRLSALSSDSVINGTYNPDANGFAESATGSWGVRAIGTTSSISPAEMALRTAKRAVSSAITSAQSDASTSLRVDAVKLANILINTTLEDNYVVGADDQTAINTAITNLKKIATSLENAMKQTVLAVAVAQNVTLAADAIEFDNGTITAGTIDWRLAKHIEADLIEASKVLSGMNSELNTAAGHVTDGKYTDAMSVMLSASDFKITDSRNGTTYSVSEIKTLADSAPVTAAGILMNTPIISIEGGVYADIAAFAGNYSANASIEVNVTYGSISLNGEKLDVTMATDVAEKSYSYTGYHYDEATSAWVADDAATTVKGYYLPNVLSHLNTVNSSAGDQNSMQIITDIYGYAIDLAFRTNATGSNLLLQTEAANRVEDSEYTQGGGSYMQFTKGNEQFTWEQLVNLIQSVRVVFISDAGSIYGVAAMQGLKYEPVYKTNADGQYVDAQGNALAEQNNVSLRVHADYVAGTAGHDLADENGKAITLTGCSVIVDEAGKTYIKAPLKLYGYSVNDKGVLSLGSELASGSLTALQQNVATAVTSLVYLDGDEVENADVAISGSSMTGTMNLQFASDATLDPMDYTFTQSQLSAPTASITEKTLTINNVEHATKYKIYFVEGSIKTPIHTVNAAEGTTTVLDLSALNGIGTPGATYNLEIVASGENYTDSTGYTIQYTVPNT